MGRSLLVVFETAFAGGWLGSTRRLLGMADGLRSLGWDITLLAGQRPGRGVGIVQEQRFAGRVVRTPFFHAYPRWVNGRYARWLWRQGWSLTGQARYHKDAEWGWGRRVGPWCARHQAVGHPELVFAVSSGALDSLVAGRNLAQQYGVPLVLEFRDPCPNPAHSPPNQGQRAALEACLESASATITTTQTLADYMAQTHPACRARVFAIHSWFDEPGAPVAGATPRPTRDTLRLLHAGTLSGHTARNARSLVRGLAEAMAQDSGLKIHLRLLAGGKGGDEAVALARELGIAQAVECLPPVAPEAALAEMQAADVLLVIKYSDTRFDMQIPGKLFEYLGLGKPILGIMGCTEAAGILARSGLGLVVANDDVPGIARCIHGLWQQRRSLAEVYEPNLEYLSQFSRTRTLQRLNQIIEGVLPPGVASTPMTQPTSARTTGTEQ